MTKTIHITIDDHSWPYMKCHIDGLGERESLFDTSTTNFVPMAQNAVMFACRAITDSHKPAIHLSSLPPTGEALKWAADPAAVTPEEVKNLTTPRSKSKRARK